MSMRLIELGEGATVGALVAAVQEGAADAIIVEVAPEIAALERHLILAAIGPLAIELAPGTRLCAIDVGAGAEAEDVAAVRDWLAGADCTTGQVVAVTGE
ncbi:MAG: hypothetical protein K2W81_10335 [Sphingomonas sp.]|uniref:Rossmann fold domain-containing protein n=1 Tax=Sphingomonas sp. TaxID=28214 RepID=UPI0025D17005|nr:hypothetical protein [Sphingomonas sp.]MBY0284347.1 hypothetical protein [Sphingomonas sp.]